MEVDSAINFLEEVAKYFENRPTNGEDQTFWSNVYNSENCRNIAKLIKQQETEINYHNRQIQSNNDFVYWQ